MRDEAPALRHEGGPDWTLADIAQFAILVSGLILTPAALFSLSEESGALAAVKNLTVGVMAAGGAFAVVRFSLTGLANLHALNHKLAGIAAIASIVIAGSALSLSPLTGLTFGSVEANVYADAGQELSRYIDTTNKAALAVERVSPAVAGLASNIDATISCEITESCLSLSAARGRGPMTRALESYRGTAETLREQLRVGAAEREDHLETLNELSSEYFEVLADKSTSISNRRASLQAIYGEVKQTSAALLEAMPIHLVAAFADELQAGAAIPGDANGSRVLSEYLRGLGKGLEEQLEALPQTELTAPTMPDKPGMMDVIRHIPDYLAFAVVVIIGDLLLPILLYTLTYLVRLREVEIMYGKRPVDAPPHPFAGLVDPKYLRNHNRGDDGGDQ
ncbi:MAG: hypothetical protein AAF092_10065 [Pseudomonadota bacterium]